MNIRNLFKLLLLLLIVQSCNKRPNTKIYSWNNVVNRIWTGENFWANRLQDWEVKDGKLICTESSEKKTDENCPPANLEIGKSGKF